ncbi:hypothetical protein WN48_08952 [Eufriesea mexicana]|uniref:H15 domain-containing protein n=1 Tax=Eufriesea mexicana TaxID=516756 RepID=A0A310S3W4_9HYME|nr:hypothetical protein WN48_08952 [Eufriesea mexicana]
MYGTLINFDSLSPPCPTNYVRQLSGIWGRLEVRLISQAPFHFRHNAKRKTNSGSRVGKRRLDPENLIFVVVAHLDTFDCKEISENQSSSFLPVDFYLILMSAEICRPPCIRSFKSSLSDSNALNSTNDSVKQKMAIEKTPKIEAQVVEAIRRLQAIQGSTPREISSYIAQEYNIPSSEIRRHVHIALKRGVTYGILQRLKGPEESPYTLVNLRLSIVPDVFCRVMQLYKHEVLRNSSDSTLGKRSQRKDSRASPNKLFYCTPLSSPTCKVPAIETFVDYETCCSVKLTKPPQEKISAPSPINELRKFHPYTRKGPCFDNQGLINKTEAAIVHRNQGSPDKGDRV